MVLMFKTLDYCDDSLILQPITRVAAMSLGN